MKIVAKKNEIISLPVLHSIFQPLTATLLLLRFLLAFDPIQIYFFVKYDSVFRNIQLALYNSNLQRNFELNLWLTLKISFGDLRLSDAHISSAMTCFSWF